MANPNPNPHTHRSRRAQVSGGSDGMLTISAGRIAKAALLHLPEGPADPPADHPSVLLEGKRDPLHPAVGLALATDRLDGGALASAERLQVGLSAHALTPNPNPNLNPSGASAVPHPDPNPSCNLCSPPPHTRGPSFVS